jgi:CIC family chloride channel protein
VTPGETTRRFREFARRSHEVIVLAAITGALTGFAVALFDWIVVDGLLDHLFELSPWVLAFMPLVGLGLSWLALLWVARTRDAGMADLYLKAFHDPDHPLILRELPGRFLAAIATPGFGGAMGLEGGSLYLGAWLGTFLQTRFPRFTAGSARRTLLVAGAAAGVAAIFKAPATGAIFALEVPYKEDVARRALLPALVASAAGYLAFVFVNGVTPLFAARGSPPPLSFADLVGALALGVAAGFGARGFSWLVLTAKSFIPRYSPWVRILVAGLSMAALFGITWALTGEPIAIGVGYRAIEWARDPTLEVWLVAVVFVVRCLVTPITVGASGVGGLFVPLVVSGALLGRVAFGIVGDANVTLFVVIGVAAFLGAGYRVPLAAVMFVAETTGRPGFIVPGLLAAVAAMLVMGRSSVTTYQRSSTPGGNEPPPPQPEARGPTDGSSEGGASSELPDRRPEDAMFVQMISGKALDRDAVHHLAERWEQVLHPGAIGFLGSTIGTTDDGRFFVMARFESADAASRNSQRPEQDAWWSEIEQVVDGAVFHNCSRVTTLFGGGKDDAGFVQVMQGRIKDRAKADDFFSRTADVEAMLRQVRPDVVGEVIALDDDGDSYTDVVYFSSLAEARANEAKEMPPEALDMMQEMESTIEVTDFLDLTRLTLH